MIVRRKQRDRWLRGPQALVSVVVLCLAMGLILYQMVSSILLAFLQSELAGIRSVAAAAFPIIVAIYLSFVARLKLPVNHAKAPVINNFIIFIFWTLMVFWLDSNIRFVSFPLEELIYSSTLAFMIWRFKRQESIVDLLACCYGIVSGSLAALIFFGWNPFAM
ncbi:MAG: hypothetical protein AAF609_13420 [Cyanobacteria bacterium P01_C01_bin.120]